MFQVGPVSILDMSDHVHVEHQQDLIAVSDSFIGVVSGTVEAPFLSIESYEFKSHIGFEPAENPCEFEYSDSSTAVVVDRR